MQGCCNVRKILDELLIVRGQSQELSNVVKCCWTRPILDSWELARVHTDFAFCHDVTTKLDGGLEECALVRTSVQAVVQKDLQDLLDVRTMLFLHLAVNKDVVQVNNHEVVQKRL